MRVSDLSVGLVEYCIGSENLYAVLLDQNGKTLRFRLLSCAQAFPAVDLLLDVLERPYAWTSFERAKVVRSFSEGWGRQLLPPVGALRAFDIVVLVPHHFLHGVPLHVVKLGEEPLAAVCGVAYCSSGTLFARCVERNRARHFDARTWTFPTGHDDAKPNGPPLRTCVSYGVDVLTGNDANYRELASAFARQFPEQAVASSRATVKIRLRADREAGDPCPDAICLVCHGFFDDTTSDRSGLLLAGPVGTGTLLGIRLHGDKVQRIRDLPFGEIPAHLDPVAETPPTEHHVAAYEPEMLTTGELKVYCTTDAQLVALFGCSTGSGSVGGNDDYVSHAYQWLKAGAASVVANLWEADFPIITDWAERFAFNWVQRRQPKTLAAREAIRGLLADRPELMSQAELWGSMAVMGDWL
jgi:hypothetical protein